MERFAITYSAAAISGGVVSDEFTSVNPGDDVDRRALADNGSGGSGAETYPYAGLLGARLAVQAAIGAVQHYTSGQEVQIRELYALLGYLELVLAEDVCDGVRLGTYTPQAPVAGAPTSRQQLLAIALAHFDSAGNAGTGSDSIGNLAAIGAARTLLTMDSLAPAVQRIAGIPTTYGYDAFYSTATVQQNQISSALLQQGYTVSEREGGNGMNFGTANDPRVAVQAQGIGPDGVTPLYQLLANTSLAAPLTVASGVEARLIEAEAMLAAGNISGWSAALDSLRTQAISPPMGTLTSDSTLLASSSTQRAVHFRERAFWLFATAHRQGDLRRLVRHYGLGQQSVWPSGPYKNSGLQYGSDITFPIVGEARGAHGTECTDRTP
jgi:hypothetical protein